MAVSISVSITQNSQDKVNNKSNVTVKVTAKWTGGSHNTVVDANGTAQAKGWVKIDGTRYTFNSTFNSGKTTSGSQVICTKTVDVSHNLDGTKNLTCSASYSTGVSSGTVTASASKVLTTIPRMSTLSVNNGTLGTAQTLMVIRQSTSYTHTITYKCGTATGTIVTKSSNTSISFTPPKSLASQSTTGTTVSITFTITTYNGSTSLGSNTKTISCSIPSSVAPFVSFTVSDAEGYSSTYGGYVQGKSKLKVAITASGVSGSTINACETTFDGKKYTSTSFTTDVISGSETLKISVTVTDSRGRTTKVEESVTVLAYSTPNISSMTVYRTNVNGTETSSGAYLTVKFSSSATSLNGKNKVNYSLKYKKVSETSYKTLTLSNFANAYTVTNGTKTFSADKNSSYDVILVVKDALSDAVEKSNTGSTTSKLWSALARGLGFAFGKVAEFANFLDVGWNAIFQKNIYMGYYHDNEKNIIFRNSAYVEEKTFDEDGVYPHNCKLYGGNANSKTAIGLYDSKAKKAVLVYEDHDDFIYTQSVIRQHVFQAYPSATTTIGSSGIWTKISLGASTVVDNSLNPKTDKKSTTTKRIFEINDGGIKCNRTGYVMISGQLYLSGIEGGSLVGACICRNDLSNYLAWNYLKHDSTTAYIPIVPFVTPVDADDVIYLAGRNEKSNKGTSSTNNGTTRLTIIYIG